ncbi:hypothetical protein ACROYT_G034600 [Oculina patagonica]
MKAGLYRSLETVTKFNSSVVTDKTGSVKKARLIEVGILVVECVENFCYSGIMSTIRVKSGLIMRPS